MGKTQKRVKLENPVTSWKVNDEEKSKVETGKKITWTDFNNNTPQFSIFAQENPLLNCLVSIMNNTKNFYMKNENRMGMY